MIKTAVILAAGCGKRMKLFRKPKGFLTIGGRPLIEYSINALLQHGIEKIIIGTGFQSHYYDALAKKYPQITTSYNEKFMTFGSLFTFYSLNNLITENFLLLEADLLYDSYCLAELLASKYTNALLLSNTDNEDDGVFARVDAGNNLARVSKDPLSLENRLEGVLVGIAKMSRKALDQLVTITPDILKTNPLEDYDFAFEKIDEKFKVIRLENLLFTEIDNNDHLNYALNYIYPKLDLPATGLIL